MSLIHLLLRTSRVAVLLATLLGLLSGAASAGLISIVGKALGTEQRAELLPLFAGLCLLLLVSKSGAQLLVNHCHQTALFGLRAELSHIILGAPLRRLEEVASHRLMGSLSSDIQVASNSLVVLPHVLSHLTVVLSCLVYLVWLSVPAFLATLGILGVGLATYWLPTRYALDALRRAHEQQDALFKHFHALTHGTKELKLHRSRRHAFLHQVLHPTLEHLRRLFTRSQSLYAITSVWGLSFFSISIGLLIFVVPSLSQVRTHELVGYTLTLLYLQQPLDYILGCVPSLTNGNIALRRFQQLQRTLASTESDTLLTPGSSEPPPVRPFTRLELRDVAHTYHREQEDRPFTLGPINLLIQRGELLFVVGGNGSGKTTLAKLLTGLYAPERGQVFLDGEEITDKNREHYRQQFTTVFSDFYLFENMLGLAPATVESQARGYLERLRLSHKVQIREGTLSTTALSQGQRKRLALLTAYLEDRPIYLFDEWAADQDPEFKQFFYEELLPALKHQGKTIVAITHDDRYFHLADRLLRLENGQVLDEASESVKPAPSVTGT